MTVASAGDSVSGQGTTVPSPAAPHCSVEVETSVVLSPVSSADHHERQPSAPFRSKAAVVPPG
ncbi:hypothetical protein GCM10010448_16600 [Streptomyces glomeratus]|uniref:Uncharacterized protein n=1 Tax=Streptomyces glomeratus TaxID=284452 RepID=A0ABP6L8P4_9ACTN